MILEEKPSRSLSSIIISAVFLFFAVSWLRGAPLPSGDVFGFLLRVLPAVAALTGCYGVWHGRGWSCRAVIVYAALALFSGVVLQFRLAIQVGEIILWVGFVGIIYVILYDAVRYYGEAKRGYADSSIR